MKPKASIVLTSYNAEKTLPDTLDSLLGQTYEELEIIAVDDGSTDGSLALLKKYAHYAKKMIILENTYNRGISMSLNQAIDMAQGTYIVRMDADDISLSDRVSAQVHVLEERAELGCVSCYVDPLVSLERLEEWKKHPFEVLRRTLKSSKEIAEALPYHNVFHGGEVVFRKALWQKVGGYRPEFIISEDYDLWLRMIDHTQFYIVPLVLYIRRFHENSNSSTHEPLIDFLAKLARKCYNLRHQGVDDRELVRTEVIEYISVSPAYKHLLTRL